MTLHPSFRDLMNRSCLNALSQTSSPVWRWGQSSISVISVLVVLIICVFAGNLIIHSLHVAREVANRAKCSSNLQQIGKALLIYSNADPNQSWPRTIYDGTGINPTAYTGSSAPDPFGKGGPVANDVTAAMYMLLRAGSIAPLVFVCPSTDEKPVGSAAWKTLSNFPDGANLSYSMANPYPSEAAAKVNPQWNWWGPAPPVGTAEFALVADMNPGVPALLSLTAASPAASAGACNSYNHKQLGQNVLYGDGHVSWLSTPLCGIMNDNIYTCGTGAPQETKGTGASRAIWGPPVNEWDSVLLPTAVEAKGARH